MHSASLDEARELHARIWAVRGGSATVRYYSCRYGSVHWTRQLEPVN